MRRHLTHKQLNELRQWLSFPNLSIVEIVRLFPGVTYHDILVISKDKIRPGGGRYPKIAGTPLERAIVEDFRSAGRYRGVNQEIAARYGLHPTTISLIRKRVGLALRRYHPSGPRHNFKRIAGMLREAG